MNKKLFEKKIGSGLVFGKFLPLHEGHVYLMNFAQQSCHRLTILVCTLPNEPIPGEVRFQWVKKMFPDANVVHHNVVIPQYSNEHPDFWNIWKRSIEKFCPGEEFDALFGSEDYGWKMADVMGIEYIPVDRDRALVPISGTEIRKNPLKHWQYLPVEVRPYFVKRVAIVGPESTGKSTLTKALAKHFETSYAHEYARSLLDDYAKHTEYEDGEVRLEDISTIARGQIATEDALARRARKVLFCDTELTTTTFWSDFYFKTCPAWVKQEAARRTYDLYLLLDVDVPWKKDPLRPMSDLKKRRQFLAWWEEKLTLEHRPFVKIAGSWDQRFELARNSVETILLS